MQRPERLEVAAVAERQRRLGAHLGADVGERREQQPRRATVLEMADEIHQQPAHLGCRRLEAALDLRQRRRAHAAQRLERRGLQPGIGQRLRSGAAPRADRRSRRAP